MLNQVRAKNFKSLKNLDYHCVKLNLLSGVNGAGKSSFIQLLLLLKEISARESLKDQVIKTSESGVSWRFSDIKYCYALDEENVTVEATCAPRDLEGADIEGWISNSLEIEWAKQNPASQLMIISQDADDSLRINYPLINEMQRLAKDKNTFVQSVKCYRDLIVAHNVLAMAFHNFKMISAFRIKPCEVHDAVQVANKLNPEGNDSIAFLHKFGNSVFLDSDNPMCHATTRTSGKHSLIDEVNAWLSEVSPGAKIDIEGVYVGDSPKLAESVNYGDGELLRSFKPQNVGFGISNVLPVLLALLTAQKDDIVIIENPEAHLHPRGQSEMGRLLACAAATGVQLFVETHSDHVIGGIQIAVKERLLNPDEVNVAFFERKEHMCCDKSIEIFAEVRDIKINSAGSLSEYPEDFLDEWNKQMRELMKP